MSRTKHTQAEPFGRRLWANLNTRRHASRLRHGPSGRCHRVVGRDTTATVTGLAASGWGLGLLLPSRMLSMPARRVVGVVRGCCASTYLRWQRSATIDRKQPWTVAGCTLALQRHLLLRIPVFVHPLAPVLSCRSMQGAGGPPPRPSGFATALAQVALCPAGFLRVLLRAFVGVLCY
jgi:hypothetical protein